MTQAYRTARQVDPKQTPAARLRSVLRAAVYVIAAALIGTALCRTSDSGPPEGSIAPGFELQAVSPESSPVSLDALKGQPVLIEVFASWCPTCRTAAPAMSRLFRQSVAPKAHFIGVSVDESLAQARTAASTWRIPFPVLLDDGNFSRGYRIKSLPTFILIDRAGRVSHVSTGLTSERRLRGWLEES
ncbi:MAG: TlpA family protein disulfide reductase [Polyangiaceae bacterium]|nr:TlpA family protein disulfide reductase [Polyangiaceae bacterium]